MPNKKRAVYAGTFDPFTYGHFDILERALNVFDEVVVLVAVSPVKSPLFTKTRRVEMLEELYKDNPKVSIDHWDGLLVEYAKKNKIGFIIRGLRPAGDFDYEFQMASMNNKLYSEIETVFFMTRGEHYFISSTSVREVLNCGGDVSRFVPPAIYRYLIKK